MTNEELDALVEWLKRHALPDPHDERKVMHAKLLQEAAAAIQQLRSERDKFKEEANIRRQQTADVTLRMRELEAELRDMQSNKEESSTLCEKSA